MLLGFHFRSDCTTFTWFTCDTFHENKHLLDSNLTTRIQSVINVFYRNERRYMSNCWRLLWSRGSEYGRLYVALTKSLNLEECRFVHWWKVWTIATVYETHDKKHIVGTLHQDAILFRCNSLNTTVLERKVGSRRPRRPKLEETSRRRLFFEVNIVQKMIWKTKLTFLKRQIQIYTCLWAHLLHF